MRFIIEHIVAAAASLLFGMLLFMVGHEVLEWALCYSGMDAKVMEVVMAILVIVSSIVLLIVVPVMSHDGMLERVRKLGGVKVPSIKLSITKE